MQHNGNIVSIVEPPHPTACLYTFHHAGSTAATFANWRRNIPADIALRCVELPLRWAPAGAEWPSDVDEITAALATQWLSCHARTPLPYGFYGHSLGALMAYSLVRTLEQAGAKPPRFLAVSGRRAPHCPMRIRPLWNASDDDLARGLQSLAPGELTAKPLDSAKWRALLFPTLRADLKLTETYRHTAATPTQVSVLAFRGADDPLVNQQEIAAWREMTAGNFELATLPGNHFFSRGGSVQLQRRLAAALSAAVPVLEEGSA